MNVPRRNWLRPEVEVVYSVCSVADEERRDERLRAALEQGPIDWDYVRQVAEINRIVPALHRGLEAHGRADVPPDVWGGIESNAHAIRLHNLIKVQELIELYDAFRAADVDVTPLKGPVLAHQSYEDPTLRQYADLDMLVARADVDKAKAVLAERDYEPRHSLSESEERELLKADCELEFDCEAKQIRFELHWEAFPQRHAGEFGFSLLRRTELVVAGTSLPTFLPEDQLLYVCVHGGDKHLWARMQWLCDVAHLVAAHPRLDWAETLERGRSIDRERAVLLGALLAWLFLDAPVPTEVIERATATPDVVGQAGLVHGRQFQIPARMPSYRDWQRELRTANEITAERGVDANFDDGFLRYARTILTPDWTDRQSLGIPRGLSFLYHVYRPLRLIRKHKANSIRRV